MELVQEHMPSWHSTDIKGLSVVEIMHVSENDSTSKKVEHQIAEGMLLAQRNSTMTHSVTISKQFGEKTVINLDYLSTSFPLKFRFTVQTML